MVLAELNFVLEKQQVTAGMMYEYILKSSGGQQLIHLAMMIEASPNEKSNQHQIAL